MSDTQNLFILAGVWTLIAAFLVLLIPKWPAKVIVFVLLVGIPFWELPYGYYNFKTLCNEHGGMKIFEKIGPQEIVCAFYPLDSIGAHLLNVGLVKVETKDQNGNLWELSRDQKKSAKSELSSQYCITQTFVQGLPWRIQRNEYTIVRASGQQLVARFSDFVWFGTWWQQQALPILGRGGECRHGDAMQAIANVLRLGTQ